MKEWYIISALVIIVPLIGILIVTYPIWGLLLLAILALLFVLNF